MTKFFKPREAFKETNSVVIQPLTLEGVERFQLWDNTEKKYVREGEEITVEAGTVKLDKYIKLTDEEKTRYGRDFKIVRNVVYDGEEYEYALPPTVNEKLETVMDTVKEMGENPFTYEYVVSRKKTGDQPFDMEYTVTLAQSQKERAVQPEIELEIEENENLSPRERKVVEAIKQKYGDYVTKPEDALCRVLVKNTGCTEARANFIVTNHLR